MSRRPPRRWACRGARYIGGSRRWGFECRNDRSSARRGIRSPGRSRMGLRENRSGGAPAAGGRDFPSRGTATPAFPCGPPQPSRQRSPRSSPIGCRAPSRGVSGQWLRSSRRFARATSRCARASPAATPSSTTCAEELNRLGDTLREQRLGEFEAWALLRKVMAEVDVVVLAFDEDAVLRLANDAAARILGSPPRDLSGCGPRSSAPASSSAVTPRASSATPRPSPAARGSSVAAASGCSASRTRSSSSRT